MRRMLEQETSGRRHENLSWRTHTSIARCIVLPVSSLAVLLACTPPVNHTERATIPPARWGAAIAQPQVKVDTVRISDGRDSLGAYVAHPREKGRHPAVIVLHANRITEPYIASTTAMLAEAGFVAMAVDIFHFLPNNATWADARRTPGDSVNAVMAREFREPRLVRNVQAGIDHLRRQPDVDPGGIALLGFCGGGWNALLLSTQLRDVGAVVAFYAPVAMTDVQHRSPMEVVSFLRVPVLFHRATTDQWVPLADVERFEAALRAQGTPIERVDYAAAHGFFAWNRDGLFNETEATRAWERTVRFLREHAGRQIQARTLAPSRTSRAVPAPGAGGVEMHVLHASE
jgi:carboxymethylenebutenolidase